MFVHAFFVIIVHTPVVPSREGTENAQAFSGVCNSHHNPEFYLKIFLAS
jgi:hypothetical protein